ncbi:MAG: hypothetical protein NVS9B7_20530 [Flavisolibacter sp.]
MKPYSETYLNTADSLIKKYEGKEPLSLFLKNYYKKNKKHGSRDRKIIADLCYCFYRSACLFVKQAVKERILIGLFLCTKEENSVLKELKPKWNEDVGLTLEEKLHVLGHASGVTVFFPLVGELSNEINLNDFCASILTQPDLFLRLRPGKEHMVIEKLQKAGIIYRSVSSRCIALGNSINLDHIVDLDRDAVVQDLNSQRVFEGLKGLLPTTLSVEIWDCCAASGGKSLLLHDEFFPLAHLTVSDLRRSIIINLEKRFLRAGLKNYHSFIADVSSVNLVTNRQFHLVIADVPCSGSGTWSRTPERVLFFNAKKIEQYAQVQKEIAINAAKAVRPGGYLVYITCSVFTKENEAVVAFIVENSRFQLVSAQYFKGYGQNADTLFSAVLKSTV